MEQIELVIRLDEEFMDIRAAPFEDAREMVRSYQATIAEAIRNGVVLPKGHGRLIDEDKIDYLDGDSESPFTFKDRIKNTSKTIVEADVCDNDCEHCDWATCPKSEEGA